MTRILLLFFVVGISLFAGFFTYSPSVSQRSIGTFALQATQFFQNNSIEKPVFETIRFVGDVMLARRVEYMMETYGINYPFLQLPEISSATALVGNFESSIPVLHKRTPDLNLVFSVDPIYLQGLKDYGFLQLSLANNHSYDFGETAFVNTNTELINASTTPFGNPNNVSTSSVSYVEIDGVTVGMLGINAINEIDQSELIKTIQYMSTKSDLQIAYLHWGVEYQMLHSTAQERLAYTLVDTGIDVVIGNHPHVVQDIELYNGTPIFYSLGNFIFDQYFSKDVQEGLMIDMQIATSTVSFKLLPVTSIGSRSSPRLMGVYEKDIFISSLKKRSSNELSYMIGRGLITVERK